MADTNEPTSGDKSEVQNTHVETQGGGDAEDKVHNTLTFLASLLVYRRTLQKPPKKPAFSMYLVV